MKKIVISIPFLRVGKIFLTDTFLSKIEDENNDLIIVTPLKLEPSFFFRFKFKTVTIVESRNIDERINKSKLFGLSELMRMNGYWYKYRNEGMRYYFHNMFKEFSEDFPDKKLPFHKRVIIAIISFLGQFSFVWRGIDRLLNSIYSIPLELQSLVTDPQKVILIQSANWGNQDRSLSNWARRNRINSYLIPYTSDQLTMNGFLMNNYKKVFVQGPIEYEYAKKKHCLSDNEIVKAGSLWLRNLDVVKQKRSKESNKVKRIIYAGVSQLYYPRKKELEILKSIIDFLVDEGQEFELIYRPYVYTEQEKSQILTYFSDYSNIIFEWPDKIINSLESSDTKIDLDKVSSMEYTSFLNCDIFIMSVSTSLVLDVGYLSGCVLISNLIDTEEGFLAQRNTINGLVENETLRFAPGCIIVKTQYELLSVIKNFFRKDLNQRDKSATTVIDSWDYGSDFYDSENLLELLRS